MVLVYFFRLFLSDTLALQNSKPSIVFCNLEEDPYCSQKKIKQHKEVHTPSQTQVFILAPLRSKLNNWCNWYEKKQALKGFSLSEQ